MGGAAEGAFDGVNELSSLLKDKTTNAFKNLVPYANSFAKSLTDIIEVYTRFDNGTLTVEQRLKGLNDLMANRFLLSAEEANEQFIRLGLGAFDISNGLYEWDRVQEQLNDTIAEANAHLDMNSEGQMNTTTAVREHIDALRSLSLAEKDISDSGNDIRTDFQKMEGQIDSFTESMVRAAVEGQSMKDALVSAAKGLTIDLISEFIKRQLAAQFGNAAIVASATATASAVGAAWAGPAFLSATATGGISSAAGLASITAGLTAARGLAVFAATGADFTTNGPQLMVVGEQGREHVSVTPLEGPNINGPQGGVTINISGDFIGTQDFVESTLMPAINLAQRQGRWSIA